MSEIGLPNQLSGSWQHALFLTYGMDIPLFEGALWRQFDSGCRNKVVLADGRRFLAACGGYSQPGRVRHLNHLYVADGVLMPHAMHAKAILLTNQTSGRLLVGSGNLGMQGMASGGELFGMYEYGPKQEDSLNAFLAVRNLLNSLLDGFDIGGAARQRVQVLFEQTPWLYRSMVGSERPVRHNLEANFLTQLCQEVGEEPVEELWVLSPFYDPDAAALGAMLDALRPQNVMLLIQPDQVSLNPMAVQRVVNTYSGHVAIHPFTRGGDHRYVHAKFYLVKTAARAVCLFGSPNLSRVAMLRTASDGNVELANLLVGERSAFDHVLDALDVAPAAARITDLVGETRVDDEETVTEGEWFLTRGELQDHKLVLQFQGQPPVGAHLSIADNVFALDGATWSAGQLEVHLTEDALQLLERAVPVGLCWPDRSNPDSNLIYISHLAALLRALDLSDEESTLPRAGALDLGDEEVERLLGELDAVLLIDAYSIWQLAGRGTTTHTGGADDGANISLDDIDYELLRRHPKVQQYLGRRGTAGTASQSRLQQLLNSIADHFQGLLDHGSGPAPAKPVLVVSDAASSETEEEAEELERERVQRSQSTRRRARLLLGNFFRRYLRGLRSRDFQELAGSDVMSKNYVILLHLLRRLLAKDWLEPEKIYQVFADSWQIFWGADGEQGYWARLTESEKGEVTALFLDHHISGMMIAISFSAASNMLRDTAKQSLVLQIRDRLRSLLADAPLALDEDMLVDAWVLSYDLPVPSPPRPTDIVEAVAALADFEIRVHFLRRLESRLGLSEYSCHIDKVRVKREALSRNISADCLILEGVQMLPYHTAREVLCEWLRVEPNLGYYRVQSGEGINVAFYDVLDSHGIYWNRLSEEEIELVALAAQPMAWSAGIANLRVYAHGLDAQATIPVHEVASQPVK